MFPSDRRAEKYGTMHTPNPTAYPDVNGIIGAIAAGIHQITSDKLIGMYLFGSLVIGDFDPATSDIDLLAVLSSDVSDQEYQALRVMHETFAVGYPRWDDRIEVAYVSVTALRSVKERASRVAVISPGEPFHATESRKDWVINLHTVREKGIALTGPPFSEVMPHITQEDLAEALREHATHWRTWINDVHSHKEQAYAILTLCRTLYAYRNGEQASKCGAARWAKQDLPQWAPLIEQAVNWRQSWPPVDVDGDPAVSLPETQRFIREILALVLGSELPPSTHEINR